MLAKVRGNRWQTLLFTTSALVVLSAFRAEAGVLPTGGAVTSGTAGIASTATQVTVTQTSAKAIVTWSNFSVGKGDTVQFNNGSGSTLNRVTGSNASQIDGALNATGSVYLINQNGIVIGKTGTVNVGGSFVASTLDIPDASYLAGGPLTFSGSSTASVFNLGQIGASGGDVALIAQTVENDGTITAASGDVGLLAGSQVTLSDTLSSNGKFQVTLGSGSSATNTGTIHAAIAELRAYGGNVYALAGNTGGSITATGIATNDGQVFLTANAASVSTGVGDITISGDVSFSGGANALTIDAFHNASVLTPISTTGGHVTLTTNDGGVGGNLDYGLGPTGFSGSLSFLGSAGSGESLTINGQAYTLLYSITDVQNIAGNLSGHFAVAGPIDASATGIWNAGGGFIPLGNETVNFTGVFDGLGHTISNLTINYAGRLNIGLFGIDTGTLTNLGLVGGSVTGLQSVGGVVGEMLNGSITNVYSTALVSGQRQVGGLVGWTIAGSISNSYTAGPVTGAIQVGGLIGRVEDGTISNAYATGSVTDDGSGVTAGLPADDLGGLVGQIYAGSVSSSYATGNVTANAAVVSGLGGAAVFGGFGGLIGSTASPRGDAASISNSYASGSVQAIGGVYLGGLVGLNAGSITNAYATGAVTGLDYVGGLVGLALGPISNSYATGAVTGSINMGGLVGFVSGSPENTTVTNSYYDIQTTGQPASADGIGLTTAQMQHAANFVGFDFSATGPWRIVEAISFPYLAWQFSGSPSVVKGYVHNSAASGGALVAGVSVFGFEDGVALTPTSSGADGYYQMLAPGPLAHADVVTFLGGAPEGGATLFTDVNVGPLTGVGPIAYLSSDIYENTLLFPGNFPSLSSLQTHYVRATGGYSYPSLTWAAGPGAGAGLNWGGDLVLGTNGDLTVDQSLTLGGSVRIGVNGGRINLDEPLSAGGAVDLAASNAINIESQITAGGAVTLDSPNGTYPGAGSIGEFGAGAISAPSLNGTAIMVVLNGANTVGSITGFTTTIGFLFNDTQALTVTGPIVGGSGLLYLTSGGGLMINGSLTSAGNMLLRANGDIAIDDAVNTDSGLALYATGAVSETGSITANALLGYSNGSTDLSGSNTINILAGYQVYHGGAMLTLSDLAHLTVTAPVAAYAVSFTDTAGLSITGSGGVTNHGGGQTLNGSPF